MAVRGRVPAEQPLQLGLPFGGLGQQLLGQLLQQPVRVLRGEGEQLAHRGLLQPDLLRGGLGDLGGQPVQPAAQPVRPVGGVDAGRGLRRGGPLGGQAFQRGGVPVRVGLVDPGDELGPALLLGRVGGEVGVGAADQLAVDPLGLLAGPHPGRCGGRRRGGLLPLPGLLPPGLVPLLPHRVEQRVQVRQFLDLLPCLGGPAPVLGQAGAGRDRLGDQRVQLVQPGVERAEQLMVDQGEVVDLDPQRLHVHVHAEPGELGGSDPLLQLLPFRVRPAGGALRAHFSPLSRPAGCVLRAAVRAARPATLPPCGKAPSG